MIEEGFLKFVESRQGSARLFYDEDRSKSKQAAQNLGNKISEWVRNLGIKDIEVAPSHGWRHRFKTEGHDCGMIDRILDAIQGHAPRTEGEKYGKYKPSVLLREIMKYPRYDVVAAETVDRRRKQVKARKKQLARV